MTSVTFTVAIARYLHDIGRADSVMVLLLSDSLTLRVGAAAEGVWCGWGGGGDHPSGGLSHGRP